MALQATATAVLPLTSSSPDFASAPLRASLSVRSRSNGRRSLAWKVAGHGEFSAGLTAGFVDNSHQDFYNAPIRCKKNSDMGEKKMKKAKESRGDVKLTAMASLVEGEVSNSKKEKKMKKKKAKGGMGDSSSSSSSSSSSESETEMMRPSSRRQMQSGRMAVMEPLSAVAAAPGGRTAKVPGGGSVIAAISRGSAPVSFVKRPEVPRSEFTNPFLNFAMLDVASEDQNASAHVVSFSSAHGVIADFLTPNQEVDAVSPVIAVPSEPGPVTPVTASPALTALSATTVPPAKEFNIGVLTGEVEVCLGGKCRKGGADEILAALQARAAAQSLDVSVAGCRKCMGKCKVAPNVRLWKGEAEAAILESNVSINDVDFLLAKHFG